MELSKPNTRLTIFHNGTFHLTFFYMKFKTTQMELICSFVINNTDIDIMLDPTVTFPFKKKSYNEKLEV